MDKILALFVRLAVWFSRFASILSKWGILPYEEWHPGKPLKILLVGYNGARNTGADARVVALTQQLEKLLEAQQSELTVMTLDTTKVEGYFSRHIKLFPFSTVFIWPLLKAASQSHVAVLCEGSTLTRTFADALTVFYCEAAGIMKRQGKPCIAYGSEVGHIDGWLRGLCKDMCSDTYFMVRTEESLRNLQALGLRGHVGTDTAWTFQAPKGEKWAREQLLQAGWNGEQPLLGVAVLNPFCWPVRPSMLRWAQAAITGHHEQQYDKLYFFSDSSKRRKQFNRYIEQIAEAVNQHQKRTNAFVVILGMERLDAEACHRLAAVTEGPHAIFTSAHCNVFQMTGLLRQLTTLVTSRYHAAVLSMERAIPLVAISMDSRLDGIITEAGLASQFLHHVDDAHLADKITASLLLTESQRQDISDNIRRHLPLFKKKVNDMSLFFLSWLKERFS